MTPVKNWTVLRTSGVARKMESTAASAMRITRDLMLSPLVRSNMTTDIGPHSRTFSEVSSEMFLTGFGKTT